MPNNPWECFNITSFLVAAVKKKKKNGFSDYVYIWFLCSNNWKWFYLDVFWYFYLDDLKEDIFIFVMYLLDFVCTFMVLVNRIKYFDWVKILNLTFLANLMLDFPKINTFTLCMLWLYFWTMENWFLKFSHRVVLVHTNWFKVCSWCSGVLKNWENQFKTLKPRKKSNLAIIIIESVSTLYE